LDKLVETRKERFWNSEAWQRDQWVKAEASKLPSGSRVLDAGAGASKYRPYFAHCRYETQDFCQYEGTLVEYLQPIDHVCDITRMPLPDGCLDAILCTEVFEHVTDPMAALAEFSRLLKPGGKLFLTAPLGSCLHMEPYHFFGGFTHYWYSYWLPRYRFNVDSIETQGGPGRLAVCYLQEFYRSWRTWEHTLSGYKRALSLAGRMMTKIPIHYILPWVFAKFDLHLDRKKACVGFMVAATRLADTKQNVSSARNGK
jgi:SAM-dependent methyltransferase